MAKKFFWKVWLRPNHLTDGVENDFVAEVSSVGRTLQNADIAERIKEEGAEWQVESILDILNRADRIRRRVIYEGCSVQTEFCHVSPRVSGTWTAEDMVFTEGRHRITCNICASTQLRDGFADVGVEVLGITGETAYITEVKDSETGSINDRITPGAAIIVFGKKIKVAGGADAGLYLRQSGTGGSEFFFPANKLLDNTAQKITAILPATIGSGLQLEVSIKTQFAGSKMLKEARIITFDKVVTTA